MESSSAANGNHLIIAIGRQYGSGGREIGRRVANRLGIAFYDNELITLAAEQANMDPAVAARSEERATSGFLFSPSAMAHGVSPSLTIPNTPLTDRIFIAQTEVIRSLAAKEDCVIIGRCADYVLRDEPGLLSVFVYADTETRVKRCGLYYGLNESEARKAIRRIDRSRADYYNFFTGQKWGDPLSYDLAIDCGRFGAQGCADIIATAAPLHRPTKY